MEEKQITKQIEELFDVNLENELEKEDTINI